MIRRRRQLESAWLLISQVDHARLSGDLAAAWALAAPPRGELLEAIAHHDDGWREWEQRPTVDDAGRPRDFTEMPLDVALEIHTRSIERCAAFGPLAGWITSGHFAYLTRQRDDAQTNPRAVEFLQRQARVQADWEQQWTAAGNAPERLATGLKTLQAFDWMSLWLCIRERTEPEIFALPGDPPVTFTPSAEQITVSPWPFAVARLEVSVNARVVPERTYRDAEDVAAVPPETTTLSWHLEPA